MLHCSIGGGNISCSPSNPISAKMPFRLQYKNIFLTYAQSDFENANLCAFLQECLEVFDPLYIVVSKELHADGNPHHHALIQLGKKPNIINEAYFDFHGRHPNIQRAPRAGATISQTRDYVIKDGDFHEEGEFQDKGTKRNRDTVYAEALQAATKEEAEEIIKTGAPRDYFVAASQISSRLNSLFDNNEIGKTEAEFSLLQFQDIPEPVWSWYSNHVLVSYLLDLRGTCGRSDGGAPTPPLLDLQRLRPARPAPSLRAPTLI